MDYFHGVTGTWPEYAVVMVSWCQSSPEVQYRWRINYKNVCVCRPCMPSMPEICDQSPTAVIWWSMQMTPILSSLKWTLHHAKTNWSTSTNGRQATFASIKPKRSKYLFYVRGRHYAEDEQPPSLPGIQHVSSLKVSVITCQWLDMFLHCWTPVQEHCAAPVSMVS